MTEKEVAPRIIALLPMVYEDIEPQMVKPDTNIRALTDVDSLSLINLTLVCSVHFGVDLWPQELRDINTPRDLARVIISKSSRKV